MEPPSPPFASPVSSITGGSNSAACSKLRLLCSYGGRILPRPRGKSHCYIGGDTRLTVVDRTTSLYSLSTSLSHALLDGRPFALKYQLPDVDLDTLVSVATDEDLENMIEEYDRTVASPSPRRLRLFLFPSKPVSTQSARSILETLAQSESRFTSALNGAVSLNRGLSDSVSVNRLLGLDDNDHSVTDSPVRQNTPSFGSIRVPVGIEDEFTVMNINGGAEKRQKQEDAPTIISSPAEKMGIPGGRVAAGTIPSDHPVWVHSDNERSDSDKVAAFHIPSLSVKVSDHPIEPKNSSYHKKPRVVQIQISGYSSQSKRGEQQLQARPEQLQQFKTAATASCFDVHHPRPRLDYQHYPIFYTPVWPIHAQMINDPAANRGTYGIPSVTEYSSPLVGVSTNQGMQTVTVSAAMEFPKASSAQVRSWKIKEDVGSS